MPTTQDKQFDILQQRFNSFIETLETMEPEHVDLEEIDRLIQMIGDLEEKCKQIKEQE
ncbi:SE1561 family protein [Caldibacillus thermoamylovorans]|uniref:SE1561 family protein n=1 Tax=Caldibacillus thermoamylovorans TaxID=35841 RepID=UPI00203EFDC6|nr:SE1561 family protein [Caldibacillus thermoamylovorans]MCM3055832.1 hypothetical protein [Caldibacillus thermoamylovorans]